ncbi:MAG: hypothetical protein ACOYN2_00375 [Patescibacteria group bacterium]
MTATPSHEELLAEIDILKRKLANSAAWMKRVVEEDIHKIAKRKVTKMTENGKEDFLRENQEAIISNRIRGYFGDILLMNAPKNLLEYLIDSEISYYHLSRNPNGDGFSVASSYNKILDGLIESLITAQYRKFVLKKGPVILRTNDPLEKALHLVITKKYILSTGRLYGLIRAIRSGEKLYEFATMFQEYLSKYGELQALLLSDEFYTPYCKLIESDIFGGKRHTGRLSFEETEKARLILTGGYQDTNGLIHKLLTYSSVLY